MIEPFLIRAIARIQDSHFLLRCQSRGGFILSAKETIGAKRGDFAITFWMHQRNYIIALVVLWGIIYLASSGYPPALLDDADTVHAEAAREMAESNNFITLYANRIRYLEKAPLMYWSIALSYKIFGVNEFASRLPIALATLALMLAVFFFGKHFFNERAGFYSGLIIAACIGIFLFTRVLWPDVMLTFFITMAFYCFLRARQDEARRSLYAHGLYLFGA